jgi:hypothetical protein
MGKSTGEIGTAPRIVEAPLARLVRLEQLSVYEHTAADEIVAAYRMSCGLPVTRDDTLGIRLDMRPDAADDGAARRADLTTKYRQWCADLAGTPTLMVVMEVLFRERGLREMETANRWRNGKAKTFLLKGLRHFAALRGNAPRGAKGWKIVAD